MRRWLTGLLATFLTVPLVAQVVLNFDDLTLFDYGSIPANYGDGLDPHIPDLQYRTLHPGTFTLFEGALEFWNNDYGNLSKVAFASANGMVAEITFVPEPGYGVTINSFAMGGYPRSDRFNTVMQIVDENGIVLLNFVGDGAVPILGSVSGPQHSSFFINFSHPGTIRLQWGTDWNVGIDTLAFQSYLIPEPATWALLLLGGGLVFVAQRGQRRG